MGEIKALERGSNYIKPHGAYMEDWRIHSKWVWETVLEVSARMARTMLETAYMVQHMSEGGSKYLSELAQDPEINGFHWLNVGNKDIVAYHVDGDHVYALTNRDGRLYTLDMCEWCEVNGDKTFIPVDLVRIAETLIPE